MIQIKPLYSLPKSCVFLTLVIIALCYLATPVFSQTVGKWDEIVGKRVIDNQGASLGRVTDTVIDLENGRYVGVLVESTGFLGLGGHSIIVPPSALINKGRRTVRVNMDAARFRAAPSFAMSKQVGPPQASDVAALYHYFGVRPYFSTEIAPRRGKSTREPLGFVQEGSKIRGMTVENLQGRRVGSVTGFRSMDRATGAISGIIITPLASDEITENKIVIPQILRYNAARTRLRLNNEDQEFSDRADFAFIGGSAVIEERPSTSGSTRAPIAQGNSPEDKRITMDITKEIQRKSDLSHHAKNIEVGTVRGKTTVRSRVENKGERDEIVQSAQAVAGTENVTNQLVVRPTSRIEKAIDSPSSVQ
jgi:sporulation protein YlmC with PRC-barrel domain